MKKTFKYLIPYCSISIILINLEVHIIRGVASVTDERVET